MVDLIDFKALFKSWSKNKDTVETEFNELLQNLVYENGELYFDSTCSITLSFHEQEIKYGTPLTLTGRMSLGSEYQLQVYDNDILFQELITGDNGNFSIDLSSLSIGNHNFRIEYVDEWNYVTSAEANVLVNPIGTKLSISASKQIFSINDRDVYPEYAKYPTTLYGVLTDENDNPLEGKTITCFNSSSTGVTDSEGKVSIDIYVQYTIGRASHTVYNLRFNGDEAYDSVQTPYLTFAICRDEYFELTFTGNTINGIMGYYNNGVYTHAWTDIENEYGEDLIVDYEGDIRVLNQNLNYTFATSGEHTIRIHNITANMETHALFGNLTNLKKLSIPKSVESIGSDWFIGTENIEEYDLYWDTPPMNWSSDLFPGKNNLTIVVPYGHINDYVNKGFPVSKLVERQAPYSINVTTHPSSKVIQKDDWINVYGEIIVNDSSVNVNEIEVTFDFIDKYNNILIRRTATPDWNSEVRTSYRGVGNGDTIIRTYTSDVIADDVIFEDCITTEWSWFHATVNDLDSRIVNGNELTFVNTESEGEYCCYDNSYRLGYPYSVEMEYVDVEGTYTWSLGMVDLIGDNVLVSGHYNKDLGRFVGSLFGNGATDNSRPVTGDVFRFDIYNDHIDSFKNGVKLNTGTVSLTNGLSNWFALIGYMTPKMQKWRNLKVKKI